MKHILKIIANFFSLFFVLLFRNAQDSFASQKIIPSYLQDISRKATKLENKLDNRSQKAILKIQRQENKIKQNLIKLDQNAAHVVFGDVAENYKGLKNGFAEPNLPGAYISSLGTILNSVNSLSQFNVGKNLGSTCSSLSSIHNIVQIRSTCFTDYLLLTFSLILNNSESTKSNINKIQFD